ncbi:hypothetical protein PR002_g6202 [Phytophthora rubi]|uniref:PI3K/PI4K catalytic domain-containing protein n=1 Tax=Phytophthora rubi TaxID=129364 RepID=A0A6A3N1W7_9STRA|nr:hypothetical protein PR002_g6202 [Phytophthora rubi]
MGTTRCEGLVRIRERVAFRASSSIEEDAGRSFSSSSSGGRRSASRLSDDVWYFCVSRASTATLEWFTVDAGTESSEEEDAGPSTSSGGAVLLASTRVSSVDTVDRDNIKLSDVGDDAETFSCLIMDDEERERLESCSLYVEDDASGIALLIETESQEQRDKWVHFLSELLPREVDGEQQQVGQEVEQSDEMQEAGEDVVEDLESLHFSASRSSISTRSLLHQGKSENLMEEDDPFGLLSLTTSALSSITPVHSLGSVVKKASSSAAPGMFAMDHFELAEGNDYAEEIEDTGDSDACVANMDFETAADTVIDPSLLLSSGRQQSEQLIQSRERATSNVTDPLSSSVIREPADIDEAGGLSRLVRWKYFDQGPKLDIEAHIRARSLGPLSLLSAMFKYRQQPFMFVVVLAQLVHNVENCMDTMDFYWPQFLQWGFVNLPDASPSVRAIYLFFLAATARRSVHLAVKATWECIAADWDAMAGGLYKRGNGIVVMLFFVTNVNFGEPRSVLPQLLFPQAPLHQRESFGRLLEQLYEYVRRAYAASQREAPFFEWLLARSKEEIVASSRNVQKQLRIGDGFLDPFPSDYHEEAQLMLLERRRSGTQHLVETKQRLWNKPAQHIFSDEVRLVRFLVDLCTYLKENISEPAQRKKQLPALLQEMLRGKHIRPEAALPLSGTMARPHRVVNVLTDEGTVFSTKARAPTLVFFEIIASSLDTCDSKPAVREGFDLRPSTDDKLDALVDAAVEMDSELEGILAPEQQEIINYLDGEVVGTYVADLIPAIRSESHASLRSSISEDLDGLNHVLPAGCTPLSEKASTGVFSDEESDGFGAEEVGGDDGTDTNDSLGSANSVQASKCPFFGERFADTQKRIREESSFARFDGWALVPVIAKSFDDMRQEVFVLQGLKLFQLIFRKHNLNLWMRYYSIVCSGKDCGLLEVITDAQSLDGLKKKGKKISGVGTSLPEIFDRACGRDPITGEHDPVRLERARANFITSMAAYSLFSYIFLVKDRHNGNIMLDTEGHVVHIDFGFVLGIAPGNTFSLETAPFKLTPEMVEVMGGEGFDRYRELVAQGLLALHLEAPQLLSLVYLSSKDSSFPCFQGRSRARIVRRLSRRLCIGWSVQDVERTAARIVDKSNGHRGTRQYDWFQKISNGILP